MVDKTAPRWSGTLANYFLTLNTLTKEKVQKKDDLFCKEVINFLASDKNNDILTLGNIEGIEENKNSNDCCIELVDEGSDDGIYKNSELEAFVRVKKGEANGIVGENPSVPTRDVDTAIISEKKIRKISKEGEETTYFVYENLTDHNFPLEGFNQKEDDSIENKWYLKPIYVKDLEELKSKSTNIYLYGYKLILTGKISTNFYDVVQKADTVKYFDLCFVELSSEGKALNYYRIRVPIDKYKKSYFFPTITYWDDSKKTVYIETAYNNNLDSSKKINPTTINTIKNVYFECSPSNLIHFRIDNLTPKLIGIATNSKPEKVKHSYKWADKIGGGRTVDFLENNELIEYTLNIKLSDGGSKVLNLIDLMSIRDKLYNSSLVRFKGEEYEPIKFELKSEGEEVGELYRLEIKSATPENKLTLQGDKIFFNDYELEIKKKETISGDWTDPGISSYGKKILQNHLEFRHEFYTDENGYAMYGYEHKYLNSSVEDSSLWGKFKDEMERGGYNVGDRQLVTKDGDPVRNEILTDATPVKNSDVAKALNIDLLDNTCCRLMEECFEKLISRDIPKDNRETKTYLVACVASKSRNDILKNLKQNQWDALVVCRKEGNESFIRGIANKNPQNYEEFCEAVYSSADSIKTKKEEFNKSWIQEVKELFKTDKIRIKENEEINGKIQEIESIEIIANTVRKCKIVSVMKDENAKNTIVTSCAFDSNSFIYCIKPVTEEVELEEQKTEISKNEINWMKEKDFINKWSAKQSGKEEKITEQFLINTNRYFDFYSGMTPYIEVWFRGDLKKDADDKEGIDRYEWNIINSIEHPYIKNLVVEDKGVKEVSLTLFDKDFASYQKGIMGAFDENKIGQKIYSLEDLIRQSLAAEQVNEEKEKKVKPYTFIQSKQELRKDFLRFSDSQTKLTPANLRIRFGYCDANPRVAKGNDKRIKEYFNSKGINTSEDNGRTHRWWDVKQELLETCRTIKINVKVDSSGRRVEDGSTVLQNAPAAQKANDNNANVSQDMREKSMDETALLSYIKDYMIVGYNSTLKSSGIEYSLKGIEVCHAEIMKKRFLQRYSEIVSNPIEVLYILMRMFNEAIDGEENPTGVKLIYYNDKKDLPSVDTINMMLDFSSLSESEKTSFANVDDYYTARTVNKISINPKVLKSISISLGGEEAIKNYSNELNRPLYKNVEALINEFCAACPSRKEKVSDDTKAYDDNGNEIKNDTYISNEVLTWFIAQPSNPKDRNIYVVLYYRKARPVKKIRLYQWGPELAGKTVVKNLSIQNKNEFAILSGVNSMQTKNGKLIRNIKYNLNNSGKEYKSSSVDTKDKTASANVEVKTNFENGEVIPTGYISDNEFDSNRYNAAFDNCMYVGKMDILGDPSLEFNLLRQPYTYPIRLEVIVPRNDLYFKNKEVREEENLGRFGNRLTYQSSNQRYHEMTGYYVITKISHNISSSGYTTSLELSSYPRIENDILIKEGGIPKSPTILD